MTTPAPFSPEEIRQLTMPSDPWLSCDDCFDLLDAVLEGTLTHEAPMDEAFRAHLRACEVCQEEAYALATLAAPDYGLDPIRAASTLTAVLRADEPPVG
jgi:hypothetical protein